MNTAPTVIFLLKDAEGFAASISDGLQPNPNSNLRRLKDSFDLSLDRYGIKDIKASGDLIHFVDDSGVPQVSILLLPKYEPPVLACAINEVITSLKGPDEMSTPMLILPIFQNLNLKSKSSANKNIIYGIRKGPETDMTHALVTRTQKLPLSFQIHDESVACILQFAHVLNFPAFTLIGQSFQVIFYEASLENPTLIGENYEDICHKPSIGELEVICEIGEILASVLSLRFLREKIAWNPIFKSPWDNEEPWRALYG